MHFFQMPKHPATVSAMLGRQAEELREDLRQHLAGLLQKEKRFSISCDEWTSLSNKRYLGIILHGSDDNWRLGMVRIEGSMPAERLEEIIKDKLNTFGLDMKKHIVGCTTDGASVMLKFGRISASEHQQCLAHALHLSVCGVLYKKGNIPTGASDTNNTDDEDDEDEEYLEGEEHSERIQPTITKVRQCVRFFRRSPIRNEVLQGYVKQEKGHELSLLLDNKTRWSSLHSMISRFLLLKNSILKTALDIPEFPVFLEQNDWKIMQDLQDLLEPIKLGIDALSSRKATLLSAEGVLTFIIGKLEETPSNISADLQEQLESIIKKRKATDINFLLRFLNNPETLEEPAPYSWQKMPSTVSLECTARRLWLRLFDNPTAGAENEQEQTEGRDMPRSMSEELQASIRQATAPSRLSEAEAEDNFLRREMNLFSASRLALYYTLIIFLKKC